ncbi:hypothetical protein ACMG5L_24250 [Escherichia coli]|uniref:hypothetical protein n=1 Tax=Escherichia coli TaxID=562 RepID=UPI0039BFD557
MRRKTAGEIKMSLMQMMGQKIDITIIDRIYRREEVDQLPEHIKANLKPIVTALNAEHHHWTNRKEMLFVILDGEQQQLARWYPLGMQDAMLHHHLSHKGQWLGGDYFAHVSQYVVIDPMVSLGRLLPPSTLAKDFVATVDKAFYPNSLLRGGGYTTETDVGWVYVHDDTALVIEHLQHRNVTPVFMTTWRDERAAIAATEKLQSVRPVRYASPAASDTLDLLRTSCCAEGQIHPLGYALVHDVSQFITSQNIVHVRISKDGDWLPVVGVDVHNEDLVNEIERTGYVRWDIADLKP